MNEKKFFLYTQGIKYTIITEINDPTYFASDKEDEFIIYASDLDEARILANKHIYDKKPLNYFYGRYNNEQYFGDFMCVQI